MPGRRQERTAGVDRWLDFRQGSRPGSRFVAHRDLARLASLVGEALLDSARDLFNSETLAASRVSSGRFAGAGDDARLTRAWEMERDFLAAHVVSWASGLRDRIHEKAKHAFFRAIADMMVEFCQRDLATLESLLGESAGRSAPEYEKIEL